MVSRWYYAISIHAPHTGRDESKNHWGLKLKISIHAPHTGRDPPQSTTRKRSVHFNPRAPYGARQSFGLGKTVQEIEFQSTRPIRGATNTKRLLTSSSPNFNPRAPYGARRSGVSPAGPCGGISIHAPHTGRDLHLLIVIYQTGGFQSTRPIRGATVCGWAWFLALSHFNPRAPYGARPYAAKAAKRI